MDKRDIHIQKLLLAALLIAFSIAYSAKLQAAVLPDSCGADSAKFDVKNQKGQSAPDAPAADKAQIVIVESPEMSLSSRCLGPSCNGTVRIGMDGKWVGASQGKSYFTFSVSPGEHHLCANWQSAFKKMNKLVAMASLTAQAGKIYYYEVKPVMRDLEDGGTDYKLHMKPLSEDEGKYGVKISALSTSKLKR